MASTPPNGHGYAAISITTAGSPHTSVITFGFLNVLNVTATACNTALRTAMNTGTTPFIASQMFTGFTIVNTYVLVNTGGFLSVSNDPTAVGGTLSGSAPPLNTAAVIRKNTGFAGRQYRGRMFMPPTRISESDVSVAGVISGTSLSASNSTWNTFYFNLGTQNLLPVIIHGAPLSGPTPVPTPITS